MDIVETVKPDETMRLINPDTPLKNDNPPAVKKKKRSKSFPVPKSKKRRR